MSEVQDVVRAAKKRDPKAFEYSHFQPVVAADYKRKIAGGMVLGDPSAMDLKPVLGDSSGGYFLIWPKGPIKSCIVYIGSEGQQFVAAASEAELISMLPYGAGVHDAMAYWSARLIDPEAAAAPPELTPATLEAQRTSGEVSDGWIRTMIAAVEAAGSTCAADPMARIEAANQAILVAWRAVCERRFETQRVAADLERPARPYRASEGFQVGERIAHPTFGEGVVEARPEPGKMTVFFLSGRKVLAQAKDAPGPDITVRRKR